VADLFIHYTAIGFLFVSTKTDTNIGEKIQEREGRMRKREKEQEREAGDIALEKPRNGVGKR
jgi:hypothetical protein